VPHNAIFNVFFMFMLFYYETSWVKVAVKTSVGSGEFKHAVIRV
jgi:hypothetical protein